MNNKLLVIAAIGALAGPIGAHAVPLYEHQYPVTGTNAWCTPCNTTFRVWDTFDLSASADVTSVDALLYAHDTAGYSGQVEYSVWTTDRTTQLFSQVFNWSALAATDVGTNRWDTTASLAGLSLGAGSYALSIYGLDEGTLAWWESETNVHGRSFQSDGGGGGGRDMSFRIHGGTPVTEVPEPETLFLTGLGLLGLALARRHKLR